MRAVLFLTSSGFGFVWADTGFENVISTGQIVIAFLVAVVGLGGAIYGIKWKSTAEAAVALSLARGEALEDGKARETTLQGALATSSEANAQLRQTVEKLEALPNLARILEMMSENVDRQENARARQFADMDKHSAERTAEAIASVTRDVDTHLARHEKRAAERHEQLLDQGRELIEALKALNGRG